MARGSAPIVLVVIVLMFAIMIGSLVTLAVQRMGSQSDADVDMTLKSLEFVYEVDDIHAVDPASLKDINEFESKGDVPITFKSKSGEGLRGYVRNGVTLYVYTGSGRSVEYDGGTRYGDSYGFPKTNGATAYRRGDLKSGTVDMRK